MPPGVTRAGVYLDKTITPYVFNAYGATFKFSSQKKLDIFCRELPLRIERIERAFAWINKFTDLEVKVDWVVSLQVAEKLYNELEVDKWQGGKRVQKTSANRAKQ
jgi:hypothetical protein